MSGRIRRKFLEFFCRGQFFRFDFIEKWGAVVAKDVLRAQRRFFERKAREIIERLSMEHAKSFDCFVCFAPKEFMRLQELFDLPNFFDQLHSSIAFYLRKTFWSSKIKRVVNFSIFRTHFFKILRKRERKLTKIWRNGDFSTIIC